MIQNYTYMDVADNSGAKQAMCFHVFGGTRRRYASLGDIVVVAVKEAIPQASVKKGDVSRAVTQDEDSLGPTSPLRLHVDDRPGS